MPRLVLAFVAAAALFAAAFAAGRAARDDETGARGPVPIELPETGPRIPSVREPVPPPALRGQERR